MLNGKVLKLLRVEQDLTQVRLSELSGIPQAQISRLERGLRPTPREVLALAQVFGLQGDE
jgi:transcriptional regulator with XRE-family HTH domain